jgi:hypothetical protein
MSQPRSAQVRQAVRAIRDFHAVGRGLPPKGKFKDSYGEGVVATEAAAKGINEDTIRKARAFADPVAGYSAAELNELCDLIEVVQTGQTEKGMGVFRPTHVIRLLSVSPKSRRKELQERAIRQGWSTARLEAEIARRYGTRRAGGRKPARARTLDDWLAQTEKLCETWRRWDAALEKTDTSGRVGQSEVPADVFQALRAATAKVGSLQNVLTEELASRAPGRRTRIGAKT